MKTQWFFHDLPAIFLGRPLPNCTGKTQTFHEKRRKRRLFFCGFLIVLLGHPPQTFHEKAWAFQDFPAIFLGHPLPNCIGKTQTFHEKRWQRPLPFCGFLIVLLGCLLKKKSRKSMFFSQFSQGAPYQIVLEKRKLSMRKVATPIVFLWFPHCLARVPPTNS